MGEGGREREMRRQSKRGGKLNRGEGIREGEEREEREEEGGETERERGEI